jgi:hypothetical protein
VEGGKMRLYVQRIDPKNGKELDQGRREAYLQDMVARQFAEALSKIVDQSLISREEDAYNVTTRYEIQVFTKKDLKKFVRYIQQQTLCGLPILV